MRYCKDDKMKLFYLKLNNWLSYYLILKKIFKYSAKHISLTSEVNTLPLTALKMIISSLFCRSPESLQTSLQSLH